MASGAIALKMAAVAAILMLLQLVPSSEGNQEQPAAAAPASSCKDVHDCISKCPSKCSDMAVSRCAATNPKDGQSIECQGSCSDRCHSGCIRDLACHGACRDKCDKECGDKPTPEYKACHSSTLKRCKKECKAGCKKGAGN